MNIRNYGVVSMPYIGLPPFLPLQCTCEEEIHAFVSMPYIGLPPFLHFWGDGKSIEYLCQCPISGFPHFYKEVLEMKRAND